MKSSMPQQKKITYEYNLPDDRIKAAARALAMGHCAALRDFPNTLTDRNEIETQARAGCVILKNSYGDKGQSKQLTNDFAWLCELFIKWYTNCYVDLAQQYEISRTYYEEMKQLTEEIGWLRFAHLLQEQYAGQMRSQMRSQKGQ